ncbi:MAG TPA: acyl-CoA dehydrogenase family protein [Acidimicrobiales bacterium]
MELAFSPQDAAFRDEVRTWLAENAPRERRPAGGRAMREFDLNWQRQQFEGGWAGVSWPAEHGGRGLPLTQQLIWYEEYAKLGMQAIDTRFVGLSHAGPTLMARATTEQQAAHLPQILRGDVVWCQGFSEPEAGSDLASLRTRAELDGDELVVTGQKIWTSYAHLADWQELLVRTDPDLPRHKGISWVICDMRSPGVEIRPIRTMDNGEDFCEVFYDEVRIPVTSVVGGMNNGWSVAMSTLSFERGTAFTIDQVQLSSTVERLIELAQQRSRLGDADIAHALARARADVAALRSLTYLSVSRNLHSAEPGPEGSMLKLQWAELNQRILRLAVEILGPASVSLDEEGGAIWSQLFLLSYASTIAGGTSEIQRNIIAERVLGLPR